MHDKGCLFYDKGIETPRHVLLECNFITSLAFISRWVLKFDILAGGLIQLDGIDDLIAIIPNQS